MGFDLANPNFLPPCLRGDATTQVKSLSDCLPQSIAYWTQILVDVVAIAAFVYLLYGGYLMLTAWGNEAKVTEARQTITAALIGLTMAVLAGFIVAVVQDFILKSK